MSDRERMAEPADINVDELRRRARRRLVGAVVLALGVAVVVPMLLETEQRPLGEDVSVKIPPIDDGKFVNKLSENRDAAKTGEKPVPGKDAATPRASEPASPADRASKYDTRVPDSPASGSSGTDGAKAGTLSAPSSPPLPASPAAPSVPSSAASSSNPAEASPSPAGVQGAAPAATRPSPSASATKTDAAKTDTKPVIIEDRAKPPVAEKSPRSDTKVASTAPSSPAAPATSAAATAAHDGFAVQLAAFADDKGANALAGRLKRSGYAAYTEPLKTSKGTLWRVRVGPYASREAALAARERLKSEGQSGIVAAVK